MLVSYHNTTRRQHNPDDLDLNLQRREGLKSRNMGTSLCNTKFKRLRVVIILLTRRVMILGSGGATEQAFQIHTQNSGKAPYMGDKIV
jgi:hypothetical protein